MLQHLFVYGTLRPESLHPLAIRLQRQARPIGRALAAGSLYDLGGYPGALFNSLSKARVLGNVFALGNGERLLNLLDAYEGVGGNTMSDYARLAIEVSLERGGVLAAWAYGLREAPTRARRIGSGDFITHVRATSPRPLRA